MEQYYKSLFKICLAVTFVIYIIASAKAQTSNLVSLSGGKLVYTAYANQGQSNAINTIPDFSYAGYKQGGIALPIVSLVKTISPIAGDNTQNIQDAIDYVSGLTPNANGIKGALLLTAGNYDVQGELYVRTSGVVLRGEGQGTDGTILHANKPSQHTFLRITNTAGFSLKEVSGTTQRIITPYVAVGIKSFEVTNSTAFAVGDLISVKKTVNQKWIEDLGMSQTQLCGTTPPPDCVGWTPEYYTVEHERTITAIVGNTITIDVPIVDAMETKYGGGEIAKATTNRLNNCGIENLRIVSAYASPTDEAHGWIAVELKNVEFCWAKNVTAQFFGFGAVSLSGSNYNTIQDCAMIDYKSVIDGGRRYGFNISSGLGNLFQRCYTRAGRHDFVTGATVRGPNVYLDCYAEQTYADIGPHHRWAVGLLYDNIRGGQIRVQNRGSLGTGHGWAGAQTMFWNLKSYQSDIRVESPPGAKNWGIGCEGLSQGGNGYKESFNTNVTPRSLYLQQLKDRLGSQAVENITILEQRQGKIYSLLQTWAGEGALVDNVNALKIPAAADAYVTDGTNENSNYGTEASLFVKGNSNANLNRITYLKFDVSTIPADALSVKLLLKVSNDDNGSKPLQRIYSVADDSWTEDLITFSNSPAIGSLITSVNLPLIGQWIKFDITSQAIAQASADGFISLAIQGTASLVSYNSSESSNTEDEPYLLVDKGVVTVPAVAKANWKLASGSSNYNWVYNFGAETGDGNTTFIGASKSSTSNSGNTGFLPVPMSGSARIAGGSSGTPIFTLLESGKKDSLKMTPSSTGTVAKFSLYNTAGSTALTSAFFTLNFDELTATGEDWNLALGSNTGTANLFDNASGISTNTTSSASSSELFAVLRFAVSASVNSKMDIFYRDKQNSTDNIAINQLAKTIDRGADYRFEMLCNNTSMVQAYTKGNQDYSVPSKKYQVWINDVRLLKATADYNFPANELPLNSNINSFVFTGNNGKNTNGGASNDPTVIISKFSMQFANSALPVSLVGFTTKEQLGKAECNWQTASERNNSHFDILRFSTDSQTAVKIGEVKGKGNSNHLVNYHFTDPLPFIGYNYYQLRQVDFDGKSSLSQIRSLKISLKDDDFLVYQSQDKQIMASVSTAHSTKVIFTLADASGKQINQSVQQLQKGNNTVSVSDANLPTGVYLIKAIINGTQTVKKIVVAN